MRPIAGITMAAITSLLLAACGGLPTKFPRTEITQLRDGVSTREEAIRLLGKPHQDVVLPRFLVPEMARAKCMRWDQRSLRALIYDDQFRDPYIGWLRETQIFIGEDGKVCSRGFWERQIVADDKVWDYMERDYR